MPLTPTAAELLSVTDLSVRFRQPQGEVFAVDKVSFSLASGDVLGIVGESGSEKSQILFSLMGLLAGNNSASGQALFNGRDLLAMIPAALDEERGAHLSMIFYEPVSALDVSIQAQVINLLMDLQDRMGLALVFIAHNLSVVRHISHQVMVMCLCHVVAATSRDAFYAKPLHPYSQALMDAVPEPDPVREKGRRGTALTGELPSVLNPPKGCVFATRCPKVQARCHVERPKLRQFGNRQAACHFVETAA